MGNCWTPPAPHCYSAIIGFSTKKFSTKKTIIIHIGTYKQYNTIQSAKEYFKMDHTFTTPDSLPLYIYYLIIDHHQGRIYNKDGVRITAKLRIHPNNDTKQTKIYNQNALFQL